MSTDYDYWLLVPWPVRRLPADLATAVVVTALVCLSVLLPGVRETPVRTVVGFPFLLFVPGYVLVAAVFPRAERRPRSGHEDDGNPESTLRPWPETGLGWFERIALSIGSSVVIVGLAGYLSNATPWGIELLPVLFIVAGFTLVVTGVAAVRRWNVDSDARFRVPYERWVGAMRLGVFDSNSRADAILGVVFVASVLLASASIAYAVAVPPQDEPFTEFYLVTENETDTLVADEYPRELTAGQNASVHLGIENHEGGASEYTVVAALQRVEPRNDSVRVLEQQELRRLDTSVGAAETWTREVSVTPTLEGERLRLVFLLYDGEAPARPTVESADHTLSLWVDVTAPE